MMVSVRLPVLQTSIRHQHDTPLNLRANLAFGQLAHSDHRILIRQPWCTMLSATIDRQAVGLRITRILSLE